MLKFLQDIRNRGFLSFWLAQLISQFGDRINQMALVGLVAGRHTPEDSALGLAKLLSFTIIPVFLIGPIAGVYVDRWDRRTTLFVCDFIRGLLVLTIPFLFMDKHSMLPIYAVVFLTFCLSRFYVPAKMSFIPDIVTPSDLHIANSLVSVTGMIAFVLGALLGGLIVEYGGARGGFLADAATFFVSGVLVFSIGSLRRVRLSRRRMMTTGREMMSTIRKTVLTEIQEGIVYILRNKQIRFIINIMAILFMAAGAVYVVIIVFIQETFNTVTKDLGFLAVALGAGLFAGSMLYGRYGKRFSKFHTIFFCLILGGLMMTLFTFGVHLTESKTVGMGLSFILGLVTGPIVISANTVVHAVCSNEMRGKVFSALEFVIHLAFMTAMLASACLARYVERYWILIGVGAVFCLVGVWGLFNTKRQGLHT